MGAGRVGRASSTTRRGLAAEEVTIVTLFLFGRAECRVGFGDFDEALGGRGIVRMEVGMIGFGEGVEGSTGHYLSVG